MATKKNVAKEPEEITELTAEETEQEPVRNDAPDPQMLAMKKEIERLQKENETLRKNSVHSSSPYGSGSDRERVAKACQDAADKNLDPWGIKISVLAQRIGKGEDSYWLSVNGRTLQVPANDRYYEMALPFAQCMVDEIGARHRAEDYIDSIEVYDPKDNPKPADKVV